MDRVIRAARTAIKVLTVLVLWAVLALLVVLGPVIGRLAILVGKPQYAENNANATNRAAATVFGWNGDDGISHECGRSECWACAWLCAALSWLLDDPDHCKRKQAQG